jgi:hypothetical protein
MLATHPDAAGYLVVVRDVGLHYYLPPVETPLTRAPRLNLARETETPFTPTVSCSVDARDTPPKEMSIQRTRNLRRANARVASPALVPPADRLTR